MKIREALTQACVELKAAGIETFSLDASLLLAFALSGKDTEKSLTRRHGGHGEESHAEAQRRRGAGEEREKKIISRADLLVMGDEALSEEVLFVFRTLIERRINGECVACIVGKKEFYGLEFFVNSSVLVPRPDTEILVEAALGVIKNNVSANNVFRVLDLCTGSGAIAVALKHEMPELEVYATDISEQALEVAKTNAERLLGKDQITFYQGDLYKALPTNHYPLTTLIISNPPYIPTEEIQTLATEVKKEPLLALDGGVDGLELITRIINDAPNYLEKGGTLLLEADPRQMRNIEILLKDRGFRNIVAHKDLSGLERVIGGVF